MIRQFLCVVACVAAASVSSGCGVVRWAICPPAPPRTRLTRETPDDAVDFLVQAFKDGDITGLYDSLHPDFRREFGDLSLEKFALVYEQSRPDFAADATNMSAAERNVRELSDGRAVVELSDANSGAFFPILFVDRPKLRIVTKDPFLGMIEHPIDMRALVRLSDGTLSLPADFALTSIDGVSPKAAAALKPQDIVRVEFAHDWVVRAIDIDRAKGIRFLDKLKENVGK